MELKAVIQSQSNSLNQQRKEIAALNTKKCKVTELFGPNDLYQTFQKLITERDDIIRQLVSNMQQIQ